MEPTKTSPIQAAAPVMTQIIPVFKIQSSPYQARTTFDDVSIQELAANLKERGLINPISVRVLADGTLELMAGERRLRAAKLLGWTEIDARVFQNVSDQDASIMGLIENLQRVDLNLIEEAKGYEQLTKEPYKMKQEDIAQKVGKSQQSVSDSFILLNLCPEVQDFTARAVISKRVGMILSRIKDIALQISLAKQAAEEGWSVKEAEKRVSAARGTASKGEGKDKKGNQTSKEAPPDPLGSDFWPQLILNPATVKLRSWGVSYKNQPVGPAINGKPQELPVWNFWVLGATPTPKADIKRWAQALADAMGDTSNEEKRFNKIMEAVTPANPAEGEQVMKEWTGAHLPRNEQEEQELEKLASQSSGPGPLYEKVLGQGSVVARKMAGLTWADMGKADPVTVCRELVKGLRRATANLPQPPAPAPAEPAPQHDPVLLEQARRRAKELAAKYSRRPQ